MGFILFDPKITVKIELKFCTYLRQFQSLNDFPNLKLKVTGSEIYGTNHPGNYEV